MLESIKEVEVIIYELDEKGTFTIEIDEDSVVLTNDDIFIDLKEPYEVEGTTFIQKEARLDLKDRTCFNYTMKTIEEVNNGNHQS